MGGDATRQLIGVPRPEGSERPPLRHGGVGEAAPGESLVVVVAASREERQRVLAGLPEDVPVLVVPTVDHARRVLGGGGGDARSTARLASIPPVPPVPSVPPGATTFQVRAAERLVCVGERTVRLTRLEFSMLRVLSAEPRRVWSFEELSRAVWSTGLVGDGAQVRAVVKRLRRKLIEADAPVCIENVRAAGFRLVDRLPEG